MWDGRKAITPPKLSHTSTFASWKKRPGSQERGWLSSKPAGGAPGRGVRGPAGPADARRIGSMARWFHKYGIYLVFPLLVIALWQAMAMAGFYRRQVFPGPGDVIMVWLDLMFGNLDLAGRDAGSWADHALASTR